jgi:glycosyltransferase involved in cell wall biosynthesis
MSPPVRVCFVSPCSYPLFNPDVREPFGGAEVQLYLLATALAGDPAFEVHVVTGDHGQRDVERHGELRAHRGIPAGLLATPRSVLRWGARLARVVHRTRAEVVVQRAAGAHTGLLRLQTWAARQRFVYMAAAEIDCDGGFERQRGRVGGALYRLGVRRADLVVSQTEEQQALLARHHHRQSVVIPSMHVVPDERTVFSHPRDSVLWVGRCEPGKRPEAFVELACRFPGVRFVMVAPAVRGLGAYFESVKARAAAVPNLAHVEFVPFREIDGYFLRARAFVLTSASEGFPNTFVQAAKSGTPIVSLSVDPDGFLGRHDCGVPCGGDTAAMAEAVEVLLRDEARWIRQATSGWRYARAHHDIEVIVERYKEMLAVVSRGDAGAAPVRARSSWSAPLRALGGAREPARDPRSS